MKKLDITEKRLESLLKQVEALERGIVDYRRQEKVEISNLRKQLKKEKNKSKELKEALVKYYTWRVKELKEKKKNGK